MRVLRTLRKEQYFQAEIGLSFTSLFLPNFIHVISVYGSSESDFKIIQNFLDRCHNVISASLLLARVAGVKMGKGIGIRRARPRRAREEGEKGRFLISTSWRAPRSLARPNSPFRSLS